MTQPARYVIDARASISTARAEAKMPFLPGICPRIVRPPDDSPQRARGVERDVDCQRQRARCLPRLHARAVEGERRVAGSDHHEVDALRPEGAGRFFLHAIIGDDALRALDLAD